MRERVLTYLFNIACTIFFILLFFYSFIMTGYVQKDLSSEAIFFKNDNIFLNCLWVMIGFTLFGGLYIIVKKFERRINTRLFAIGVTVCTMMICLWWVVFANVAPEADQWNVSFYADAFNDGDFSGFEKGKYIATCPHQLGIVTFLRILYGVFGANRYSVFCLFSIFCVGIIVYVGYVIVRKITQKNIFAEIVYLLLTVFCFPMHIYTLFVYGEIPSTAVLFVAAWLILSCLEKFHWGKVAGLFLCAGAAVQFRQNSLIVLIGFIVVIVVKILQQFNWGKLVMIVAIPAGIIAGNFVINSIYKDYYVEDASAIPTMMYITMGTNWEEENPGWFSGYNYDVFFENDCNAEICTQVAIEDLRTFIMYCIENPRYALEFYEQKFIAQWNDPMYHCLIMNCNVVQEQNAIVKDFYFGEMRLFTEEFMNIYQLLVYGAILYWLLSSFRKKQNIEEHILMVGIFGGFLFSLIWEAKTRYIFPYFIMMLPYAAIGIEQIVRGMYIRIKRLSN